MLTRLAPANEGFIAVQKRLQEKTSVYNTKHMFLIPETSICNIFKCIENLTDVSVGVVSRIQYGRP